MAAAHLQLGHMEEGRRFLALSHRWGSAPSLERRVLLAGLHNTLGRASSLIDEPDRALLHFAAALSAGDPSAAGPDAVQARARAQRGQLGLPVSRPASAESSEGVRTAAPLRAVQPLPAAKLGGPHDLPAGSRAPAWLAPDQGQAILIAWTGHDGAWHVGRVLPGHGLVQSRALHVSAPAQAEDAALLVAADGHALLVRRSGDGTLHWRRSTEPGDVRAWSAEHALAFARPVRRIVAHHTRPGHAPLLAVACEPDGLCAVLRHGPAWDHWDTMTAPPADSGVQTVAPASEGGLFGTSASSAWHLGVDAQHWQPLPEPEPDLGQRLSGEQRGYANGGDALGAFACVPGTPAPLRWAQWLDGAWQPQQALDCPVPGPLQAWGGDPTWLTDQSGASVWALALPAAVASSGVPWIHQSTDLLVAACTSGGEGLHLVVTPAAAQPALALWTLQPIAHASGAT